MSRPIAIDLFCGAGGLSLGFEQAGFDIVLGVDRDPYHCAAHERNFPYGKTLCASVVDLDANKIREVVADDREIDVVFGGPPCQGFSMMGKRDIGDPRSSLVGEFVRIIKELRPKSFVMENVPGMQLGKTRAFFEYVIDSLSAAGYKIVTPARTLVASDFGAPQKRERLFLLGIREDIKGEIRYPDGPLQGQAFARNVGEAFEALPDVDSKLELFDEDSTKRSPFNGDLANYSAVLAGLRNDPTDLSYKRIPADDLIFGNKRTKHAASSIELYAATKPGEMVPGHKLPRLSFDGVSPTLRAGSESERGSHTAPRPIHPVHPRCITVREAARLHGYPDWFAFYPVIHHGFRQVGNSVSPFVARSVGYSIADALGYDVETRRPAKTVSLSNEFRLIDDRKKAEKRISHVDEFPKVINYLFDQRFDFESGVLRFSEFSLDDIDMAIRLSGAKMPRIRPDSFLSEFSRTRNASEILRHPMKHGFSVASTSQGGIFVPKDHASAIGRSAYTSFSSAEVKDAVCVSLSAGSHDELGRAFALLSNDILSKKIGKLLREGDLFELSVSKKQEVRIDRGRKVVKAVFWRAGNALVQHEAVRKLSKRFSCDEVVVSVSLTQRHEGVMHFKVNHDKVVELHKSVYLLD